MSNFFYKKLIVLIILNLVNLPYLFSNEPSLIDAVNDIGNLNNSIENITSPPIYCDQDIVTEKPKVKDHSEKCITGLTKNEIQTLKTLEQELSRNPTDKNAVDKIITNYEKVGTLTPALRKAIIAGFYKRVVDNYKILLSKKNIAEKYLNYQKALESYIKNRNEKWFDVFRKGENNEYNELTLMQDQLVKEINGDKLIDPSIKTQIRKGIYNSTLAALQISKEKINQFENKVAIAQAANKTVLYSSISAGLIVGSIISAGALSAGAGAATTAAAVAATETAASTTVAVKTGALLTSFALATTAGTLGGAGMLMGIDVAKILANSASPDFLCNLVEEVAEGEKNIAHNALVGAAFGGGITATIYTGGLIGGATAVNVLTDVAIGSGIVMVVGEGVQAHNTLNESTKAFEEGDSQKGFKLYNEGVRQTISTAINGGTLIPAVGALKSFKSNSNKVKKLSPEEVKVIANEPPKIEKEIKVAKKEDATQPKSSESAKKTQQERRTVSEAEVLKYAQNSRLKSQQSLKRNLTESEMNAISEAHFVGLREMGSNGDLAGLGNYTKGQLLRKTKILREAGFSPREIKKLMDDNIVGTPQLPEYKNVKDMQDYELDWEYGDVQFKDTDKAQHNKDVKSYAEQKQDPWQAFEPEVAIPETLEAYSQAISKAKNNRMDPKDPKTKKWIDDEANKQYEILTAPRKPAQQSKSTDPAKNNANPKYKDVKDMQDYELDWEYGDVQFKDTDKAQHNKDVKSYAEQKQDPWQAFEPEVAIPETLEAYSQAISKAKNNRMDPKDPKTKKWIDDEANKQYEILTAPRKPAQQSKSTDPAKNNANPKYKDVKDMQDYELDWEYGDVQFKDTDKAQHNKDVKSYAEQKQDPWQAFEPEVAIPETLEAYSQAISKAKNNRMDPKDPKTKKWIDDEANKQYEILTAPRKPAQQSKSTDPAKNNANPKYKDVKDMQDYELDWEYGDVQFKDTDKAQHNKDVKSYAEQKQDPWQAFEPEVAIPETLEAYSQAISKAKNNRMDPKDPKTKKWIDDEANKQYEILTAPRKPAQQSKSTDPAKNNANPKYKDVKDMQDYELDWEYGDVQFKDTDKAQHNKDVKSYAEQKQDPWQAFEPEVAIPETLEAYSQAISKAKNNRMDPKDPKTKKWIDDEANKQYEILTAPRKPAQQSKSTDPAKNNANPKYKDVKDMQDYELDWEYGDVQFKDTDKAQHNKDVKSYAEQKQDPWQAFEPEVAIPETLEAYSQAISKAKNNRMDPKDPKTKKWIDDEANKQYEILTAPRKPAQQSKSTDPAKNNANPKYKDVKDMQDYELDWEYGDVQFKDTDKAQHNKDVKSYAEQKQDPWQAFEPEVAIPETLEAYSQAISKAKNNRMDPKDPKTKKWIDDEANKQYEILTAPRKPAQQSKSTDPAKNNANPKYKDVKDMQDYELDWEYGDVQFKDKDRAKVLENEMRLRGN